MDNFIEILEGDPPPGVEVHTLAKRPDLLPDSEYRTIRVTRTDGSQWICRAVIPARIETPIADIVSPMPDGQTFCTGYCVIDRDDPKRAEWIMQPLDIFWSDLRDQVFFCDHVHIAAFGRNGPLWELDLPDADPDACLLFDFITDDGVFQCAAQQLKKDADGYPVFARYRIDPSGNIARRLEEP